MEMSEYKQLDLLDWTPPRGPADIIPFPLHRSHGATAGVARRIVDMRRPDRTAQLNKIRHKTRKELELLVGKERASFLVERYISTIRAHFTYLEHAVGGAGASGPDDGPRRA